MFSFKDYLGKECSEVPVKHCWTVPFLQSYVMSELEMFVSTCIPIRLHFYCEISESFS